MKQVKMDIEEIWDVDEEETTRMVSTCPPASDKTEGAKRHGQKEI